MKPLWAVLACKGSPIDFFEKIQHVGICMVYLGYTNIHQSHAI